MTKTVKYTNSVVLRGTGTEEESASATARRHCNIGMLRTLTFIIVAGVYYGSMASARFVLVVDFYTQFYYETTQETRIFLHVLLLLPYVLSRSF